MAVWPSKIEWEVVEGMGWREKLDSSFGVLCTSVVELYLCKHKLADVWCGGGPRAQQLKFKLPMPKRLYS